MTILKSRSKNTQSDWESSDFILAVGEAGVAIDTGASRYGNGVDIWSNLPNPTSIVTSVAGQTGDITLTPASVGLDQVDNTSDAAKPISAAQQVVNQQLADQITNLGETSSVTAETIGLGNVDDTSDINKPISTATQIALNAKAPINNPSFAGVVQGITKSMVGLAQVDNTSDLDKPISTATQTALNTKASTTDARLTDARTPTTGSVTNTSVASNAAISMDKIADSTNRLAMTPAERSAVAGVSATIGNFQNGVINAGTGALAAFTSIPANSAVVAIGPNALQSMVTASTVVGVGKNAASKGTTLTDIVALGDNALQNVNGASNTGIGQNAGLFVDNGTSNVYIGPNSGAGRNNTGDVAVGGYSNIGWVTNGLTGNWERHNTKNSNMANTNSNVAIGTNSLMQNGIGGGNVGIGVNSLASVAGTNSNVAIGDAALGKLNNGCGPTGLALTSVNINGAYNWSGTTLTITAANHTLQVGDYIIFTMTGGSFRPTNPVVANAVRALVHTVIDANSIIVTEVTPGVPIQSLTDVGSIHLISYERGTYSNNDNSNLAVGNNAGQGLISGTQNTFIGSDSGPSASATMSKISIFGSSSGKSLVGASDVVLVGYNTGASVVGGSSITLVGNNANTAAGALHASGFGTAANPSGNDSVAVGYNSAAATGATAIGSASTAIASSTVVGASASASGTGVVIGNNASGNGNTTVVIGAHSGGGNNAIAIGDSSSAGDLSTAIGVGATATGGGIAIGKGVIAGANQIKIGDGTYTNNVVGLAVNVGANSEATTINIGNATTSTSIGTSNTSGAVTIKAQLVTIDDAGATSDVRDKADIRDTRLGLDFINSVRPVEYKWAKRDGSNTGNRYHQGVIAQEVKEVMDQLDTDFGGFIDQRVNGGEDKMMIRYNEFIAPLIRSVQELSAKVEYLEGRLNGEEW